MSIVFKKLDQSIFTLTKKGQAACLACLGMEKTGTGSTTTFLLSFLYTRSSKRKMKKLLLVTHSCLCVNTYV